MATLKEKLEAELENIERVLAEIPYRRRCSNLSIIELTGVAALLHNFYNGVENILKQILTAQGRKIPQSPSWHRDVIELAVFWGIMSKTLAEAIRPYLAFRHFFIHSYATELDPNRIEPLVKNVRRIYKSFRKEIKKAIPDHMRSI